MEGTDFAARAVPPNLGMLMLRYPVSDTATLAEQIQAKGWTLEYAPMETMMPPYGAVKVFAVRDPNGGWLEFFEPVE